MASFVEPLRRLNELKQLGIVQEYAIGGAMAVAFWTEPVPTYDVDVFIVLPPTMAPLVSLAPIYEWAAQRGFAVVAEHVVIDGIPVQFLPSHNALSDEAIGTARTLDYEGTPVRVIRPEYLAALYLEPAAQTPKRRERAAALIEVAGTDQALFRDIARRFNLEF